MSIKLTIADPSIRIRPSEELCTFIASLTTENEMPENVLKIFQSFCGAGDAKVSTIKTFSQTILKPAFTKSELKCLRHFNEDTRTHAELKELVDLAATDDDDDDETKSDDDIDTLDSKKSLSKSQLKKLKEKQKERARYRLLLTLNDIKWLNVVLTKRRAESNEFNVYLHELLATSQVILPKNEIQTRNPVLEARCVRLRLEQDARMYNSMTRNVDSSRKQMPEDTIAYQSKCPVELLLLFLLKIIFEIFSARSEANEQANDCGTAICFFGGGWFCVWFYWCRTDDWRFGLWIPPVVGHYHCACYCFGRDLLPGQETERRL